VLDDLICTPRPALSSPARATRGHFASCLTSNSGNGSGLAARLDAAPRWRRRVRRVERGIARPILGLGREREACGHPVHQLDDAEQQVLLDVEEFAPVRRPDVREDLHLDRRAGEVDQADARGIRAHPRVREEQLAQLDQQQAQLVGGRLVAQVEPLLEQDRSRRL
jgi:hypothetical protein